VLGDDGGMMEYLVVSLSCGFLGVEIVIDVNYRGGKRE
jgi:hypothetical protein